MKLQIFLTLLLLTFFVNSCTTTRIVPIVESHHSKHSNFKTDSVHIIDSIFIYINGDTIHEIHWRDRWRDRIIQDTVWLADTIPQIEVVEVEKNISFWERVKLKCWNYRAFILFIISILLIIKTKLRVL